MGEDTLRSVGIERTGLGRYEVKNVRGGTLAIGEGNDADFTPVELLLAAIGGCTAIDVDYITSRRAEPGTFTVAVTGDKMRTPEAGNHLENLQVTFTVRFPDGEEGDSAREALPRAVKQSRDRLCTVSRTVEAGTPVRVEID
ncbi:OsmC family protein [Actinokineospora sp.]|uniref:OsmC family protein n=1 Tax=Actinokineospora sp. TaxID=1872133 RepID=UPI003D6A1658